MTRLMIIVGSVRPGRVGLPIATWVHERAAANPDIQIDFVDLVELDLPFMDEPEHPRLRRYTQPHTIAWSARVEQADAFILVAPEYNYSYAPALKNALDFLSSEWRRKPVGFVSYGGASAGTRAAAALTVVCDVLGLVKLGAQVEINFVSERVHDGVFAAQPKETAVLDKMIAEIIPLSAALATMR